MYDIFYYIFAAVTISMAFIAAFSGNIRIIILSSQGVLSGMAGLMILLKSELFSFVLLLTLILATTLYIIYFPKTGWLLKKAGSGMKRPPIIYVIITGLLCSLSASLASSTRWGRIFLNNDGTNSFMLLFTKYLPILVLSIIGFSILIISVGALIRTEVKEGEK